MANTRKLLSQAVAFGNAQGSLVALSELSLTEQDIGWDEIKELASHSAKGTMIGNVANAIYFGDEKTFANNQFFCSRFHFLVLRVRWN